MKAIIVLLMLLPIKGKIVDSETKEELVGVKIENVYTDFEGNCEIQKGKVKIIYPSYQTVDTILIKDFTIELKKIN